MFNLIVFISSEAEWDTKEFDLDDITRIGVICLDNLLRDADAMKNGVIYIQNCDKMGFNHAKFHTLYAMRRIVNIFLVRQENSSMLKNLIQYINTINCT